MNEVLMRRVDVVTLDSFGTFPVVTVAGSGCSASQKGWEKLLERAESSAGVE